MYIVALFFRVAEYCGGALLELQQAAGMHFKAGDTIPQGQRNVTKDS